MKKIFLFLITFIFPLVAIDLKEKLGIGFGWNMPKSFWSPYQRPDWVCGKIGISSKFAIEPYAALNFSSQTKELRWGIGGILNYTYRSQEKSNLYLKGGINFNSSLSAGNWQYFKTGLMVGLGIEIWFFKNFSLDFSAYTNCTYHKDYENSLSNFSASFYYPLALIFYY